MSKAVQLLKGGSSKWFHETFGRRTSFAWQNGYGVFSVSHSALERTKEYIRSQELHHRGIDSAAEWQQLVERLNQPSLRD